MITFPLVKPALIGSMLLIFVLMAEEFPVPQILGRPVGIDTLSVRIYSLMSQVPNQPGIQSRDLKLGIWRWPAFGLCGLYMLIALGLPMAALIFGSMQIRRKR